LIDIDRFKNYNDSYGHLQGDIALQTIARTITNSLKRSNDFIARWGGEEFVVVLPATSEAGALDVAEQMRETIMKTQIASNDKGAEFVTVSIGVNTIVPESESSLKEFIEGSDSALYEAKRTGRNRVCKHESNEKSE